MIWTTILLVLAIWAVLLIPVLYGLMRASSRADLIIDRLNATSKADDSFAVPEESNEQAARPREKQTSGGGFWHPIPLGSESGSFSILQKPQEGS